MKLHQLLEALQSNLLADLCADLSLFMSLNTAHIAQYAIDSDAKLELQRMQQTFRAPAINGKQFADVPSDRMLMSNPKGRAAVLQYIYQMLQYTEPRLKRFLNDEGKSKFLPRFERIKQQYVDLVNKQ